ncbi:calcium/sodium antiporter [Endozoicomonas sp. OPT23]|uniref:calcium/sodium antiporter n=1 Tax=Endozoicomonas sp. OPT23 TaxID=2072845 RepID=UPI00129BDC50|nr:calcium/sodium antiporter [Endozoicomonas sp. OPT23]MRI34123.1 calcium/sodium antiporter [Endozoicomonas sp. OPT23]
MLIALLAILAGFIILTWSADRFVAGAAATASNMNISPMLIGLTVVSIGTSAPEILVSLVSALQGFPTLAVGNALGSNIANMGLVLGVTALIAPLPVKEALAKKEIPLLLIITLAAGVCLLDGALTAADGIILLMGLIVTLYLMIRWQKQHPEDPLIEDEEIPEMSPGKAWFLLASGLLLLLGSSQLLVWGATEIARFLGVSELIIGLTIVAIGTSLPELAASVTSALKGHHDIALGNVIGSNIFNLLAVLSMPGLVAPSLLESGVVIRDYPVMLGMTVLIALLCMVGKKPRSIGRATGVLLLTIYALYNLWLFISQ